MEYVSEVAIYWQIEKAIEKTKQKSKSILIIFKNLTS